MSQELKFEQALAQLEEIVAKIEQGKISLEESIDQYAKGTELVEKCRSILDSAERKIQVLSRNSDNQPAITGTLPEEIE